MFRTQKGVANSYSYFVFQKEYLIRMVNDLRKQVTEERTASATTHNETENEATRYGTH